MVNCLVLSVCVVTVCSEFNIKGIYITEGIIREPGCIWVSSSQRLVLAMCFHKRSYLKKAELINLLALYAPHLRILLQRGLEMQKSFKFKQHLRTVLQIKSTQTLYECLQSAALILLFIGRHIAKLDYISAFIFSKLCINSCCTWHL